MTAPTASDAPILVTGATGTTGSRVVAALRRGDAPVRAASRTPVPSDDPGVTPVRFSWEDPTTWDPALDGARGVYVLGPLTSAAPDAVLLPFVDRARALGVGRIVLLSGSPIAAGDPGLGRVHAALAAGPPGWAVLRPTWFAQNLVDVDHHVGGAVAAGEEIVTATGTGRIGFVDAADIAAVAARALLDPEPHDTDHLITGPEALSYDDVAEILSVARGREVRHRAVREPEAADAMAATGMPREYAGILAAMETAIAEGSEDRTTDTVLRVTGRAPRGVAEVVVEHVASGGVTGRGSADGSPERSALRPSSGTGTGPGADAVAARAATADPRGTVVR